HKVILPELFGEDERLVTEANALTQAASRASLLLGPVVAGVLISLIGAPAVLLVDGASYVVSFLLVALFVPRRPPIEAPEEGRSVRTAVRFLVRGPLLARARFAPPPAPDGGAGGGRGGGGGGPLPRRGAAPAHLGPGAR